MNINAPEAIEFARAEITRGRGVELTVGTMSGEKRFFMIPSTCYSDQVKTEVMLAITGKACFLWDGVSRLNEFVLASAGFPIFAAREVVSFLAAVMFSAAREMRELSAPVSGASNPVLIMDRQQPEKENSHHVEPTRKGGVAPRSSRRNTTRAPRRAASPSPAKARARNCAASPRLAACAAF